MLKGTRDYLTALQSVPSTPALRAWFKSVLVRGAVFGVVLFLLAAGIGAWWISSLGESPWFDVGAVFWILILVYFSGAIFGLAMAMGMPLFTRERALVQAISGHTDLVSQRVSIGEHLREISTSLVSVFMSLIAWPFLLVPVLVPFAVCLLAWTYAREAHATNVRISKEFPSHVRLRNPNPTKKYLLGVGLIPSTLSLLPFVAFFAWPTLLVSGLAPAEPKHGKN